MRYRRGSVALSETLDLPLMLHVRNARCITREQLRELLDFEPSRLARRRLAWRAERLVAAHYLDAVEERIHDNRIYTISRKGLQYLEMRGEGLVSVHSSMDTLFDPAIVAHAVDLVQIRVALRRAGILVQWRSDAEVSSENMETGGEYAKDYDAIATLRAKERSLVYGIEYERSVKSRDRYRDLRIRIGNETRLDGILYLVQDASRQTRHLSAVAEELSGAHPGIRFGSFESFLERGPDAIFLESTLDPGRTLRELLDPRIHPSAL